MSRKVSSSWASNCCCCWRRCWLRETTTDHGVVEAGFMSVGTVRSRGAGGGMLVKAAGSVVVASCAYTGAVTAGVGFVVGAIDDESRGTAGAVLAARRFPCAHVALRCRTHGGVRRPRWPLHSVVAAPSIVSRWEQASFSRWVLLILRSLPGWRSQRYGGVWPSPLAVG